MYISNNFELKHFVVDIESGSNIGHIGTSFYVLQTIWHHSYPFTEKKNRFEFDKFLQLDYHL